MADLRSSPAAPGAGDPDALPPAGLRVRLAASVILRDTGRTLAGGHPFQVLRLTDAGASRCRAWVASDVIGPQLAVRMLARRLLDAGMLMVEDKPRKPERGLIEAVVPVHDRPRELASCLAALTAQETPVTVVDDGSHDAAAIAQVARRYGTRLLRLTRNKGPAAARNAGLRAAHAPLVAFVDSDVVVGRDWLTRLVPQFDDPMVAVAAPRVYPLISANRGLARYETRHSSLDMGAAHSAVGPGHRVAYVPGTSLLVRRAAVVTVGFDETLRIGEDVDFCWRVIAAGWRVVYEPRAAVQHRHRFETRTMIRDRWRYGCSIGPLALRHPQALVPLRAQGVTAAAVIALSIGKPGGALPLVLWRMLRLRNALGGDTRLAARLAYTDMLATVIACTRAARRTWLPLLLLSSIRSRRLRHLTVLSLAMRLFGGDRISPQDLPYAVLDDLLAATANLRSCAHSRTLRPLLPRTVRGTEPAR